jgi:hypothetical protein
VVVLDRAPSTGQEWFEKSDRSGKRRGSGYITCRRTVRTSEPDRGGLAEAEGFLDAEAFLEPLATQLGHLAS